MGFMKACLYCQIPCSLGEGVLFDHRSSELIWVDIEAPALYILDGDELTRHMMPELIGFVALATRGKYVVGLQTGLFYFDKTAASISPIFDTSDYKDQQIRWNDGKCSPTGEIWAGTMHLDENVACAGALYKLDKKGQVTKAIKDVSISNGIAWHEDLHRMYYIDSPTRQIQVYDTSSKDSKELKLISKIDTPQHMGFPDGMTIDEEGMLWVAHWDGGCVARWHPMTGQVLSKVNIPAPRVTSCTFGGPDKSRLFVSTARTGLSQDVLEKYPLSGSIFVIDTNTNGKEAKVYGL